MPPVGAGAQGASAGVNVASLRSLLAGARVSDADAKPAGRVAAAAPPAPRTAPQPPPRAPRAQPQAAPDFGDGGAFPNLLVLQYPLGMGVGVLGPGGLPPQLDVDYAALQEAAGRLLLRQGGGATPEHDSLCAFLRRHGDAPLAGIAGAVHVARKAAVTPDEVAACLSGDGTPLVVTDALRDWPAAREWTPTLLRQRYGGDQVTANDRAPARHTDALRGRAQRSAHVPLEAYLEHYQARTAAADVAGGPPPFYLNGWRALSAHPELAAECPRPYFLRDVDLTEEILAELNACLFRGRAAPAAGAEWWRGLTTSLFKLFLGPSGTVTRLHYDAGDAHGWLAQLWGRKLFVLFSPADTARMGLIPEEVETAQSDVDPLVAPGHAHAPPPGATPYVALLEPGEAILIPRGWWHYAAALQPSLTAQANFYGASNVHHCCQLVMAKLRAATGGAAHVAR